jgi:hypothetical protein
MRTGMFARSHASDVAVLANHRSVDSQHALPRTRRDVIALRRKLDAKTTMGAKPARCRQRPSLDFRRSLTACGFALPPDDFIT